MLAAAAVLPALPGDPGLVCLLRTLTGVPCPLCGMTTSVDGDRPLDLSGASRPIPRASRLVAFALFLLLRAAERLRVPAALPLRRAVSDVAVRAAPFFVL